MGDRANQADQQLDFLEQFNNWARLYREDRFNFERERRRLIEENIAENPEKRVRDNLRAMQRDWDRILRGAGSGHNRFVMIQTIFWDHVVNVCLPALQGCTLGNCTSSVRTKTTKPLLNLVAKKPEISASSDLNKLKMSYVELDRMNSEPIA